VHISTDVGHHRPMIATLIRAALPEPCNNRLSLPDSGYTKNLDANMCFALHVEVDNGPFCADLGKKFNRASISHDVVIDLGTRL
jgi:hypothetical protein